MKKNTKAFLDRLTKALGVTLTELQNGKIDRRLSDARAITAVLLTTRYQLRQQELASLFNTSQVAVSKMLQRHTLKLIFSNSYQQKFNQVKDTLHISKI